VPEKAKILLVDDRAENIVALEAILASLNQVLVTARSGDAALKALLSDEFAVILLDVLMPGMDGFETAAHIKRRPRTRDIPIIFLTARNAEPDYAFRSYSAGVVDYIAKPFDPWILRAKVSVFVDLYLKKQQLSEQAAMLRAQLGDSLGERRAAETGPASAHPVLAELSARLAAVEDMVTELSGQVTPSGPPGTVPRQRQHNPAALALSVHQLEQRVARLRGVFDALRVDI
jgi:CheY-like chemotaxis protein